MQLVIQTAFAGDCVLSLPFLKELDERVPKNEAIVVVTQDGVQADLFELAIERYFSKTGNRVHCFRFQKRGAHRGLWAMRSAMRELALKFGKVERAFCLQRSFRSALLALFSGAKDRVGFGSGAASFLYTKVVSRAWDNGQSEIEKNIDLLRVFEDVPPVSRNEFPSLLRGGVASKEEPRLVVAIGSPWPTKRWPEKNLNEFLSLCVEKGVLVDLIGDRSAVEQADRLCSENPSLLITNHVGKTSAQEWVDLIAAGSAVLSGDSASVHIASDLDVPVFALFGPTVPAFGFAPWRRGSKVLQLDDLPCRPCHIHGPKECPLSHHHCMIKLEAKKVFQELEDLVLDPASKNG